jgi:mono/diheme cytochrome c family protein
LLHRTAVALLALGVSVARADLTASYDGELRIGRSQTVAVVGALVESNRTVIGSVDVALTDTRGGLYRVNGSRHGRQILVRGANDAGSILTWHATLRPGSALSGVARIRRRHHTVRGSLVLRARPVMPPPRQPGTCDSADNAYFHDVVMTQVLVPICGQCHIPGGIAQATNFRVTASDPLATQRSVALNINSADPSASRILQKPLGVIPHGGGQQIVPGSSADQILRQWVDIVASGRCGGSSGDGTGNPLYTANCASCHGPDAHGVDMKPDIHCSRAIHDIVRSGLTGGPAGDMPAFPNLTDTDIATLQAYLDGLCPSPTGADLYVSNCVSCHGADGGGTARAPTARCATRVADALAVGRAAAMPAFTAFTSDDVTHVQQYLDQLCTAAGVTAVDLYAANCSTCHGPTGSGGENAFGAHGPDIHCYDPADFYEAIQFGQESMPSFPALDADRIAKIIAWVRAPCGG